MRAVAVVIGPVMPSTPERIFEQLGVTDPALKTWESVAQGEFAALTPGLKVCKGEALFPRLDIQKELERDAPKEEPKAEAKPEAKSEKKKHAAPEYPQEIPIDDFFKVKLQVARVTACEKVEKSKKLLKLQLSLGPDGNRQVVSGIAAYYTPEEMVGKQVVLVSNLKPAKLAGIESQGMVLCAATGDDSKLKLVTVEDGMEDGAVIS